MRQRWGIDLNKFKAIEEKAFIDLTDPEALLINDIRNNIPQPTSTTIMQKVVTKSDMLKYISGEKTALGGYVSTAADAKHLKTYEDLYYGLRLDYLPPDFKLTDGSCGVIRFKAKNAGTAEIPRSTLNNGTVDAPYPYTGHGFTSGTRGRLGVPEFKMGTADLEDGAELYEIFSDGTESLKAVFSKSQNRFIPIQ